MVKQKNIASNRVKNFWSSFAKATQDKSKIKKPIYALAPMAGVADSAFRQICKSFGADVVYSEMISATAIVYNSKKTLALMKFDKKERPFVIQLFGGKPEHFAQAAEFITGKIKPDGIDINFGCPVKKVARQGAGAALMNDLKLARKIIEAVIKNTDLPVSIKCRSVVGRITALDFLESIKDLPVAAVMIHGRSLAQGHSGSVDWEIIRQAKKYFKGIILANGGVKDRASAEELLNKTGADGLGIGQGALGRPWIFSQLVTHNSQPITKKLIFQTALKHAELAYKLKGKQGIIEMRKHLCWYVSGLPNAGKLRQELVKVENIEDIKKVLK
ncbi:MAG: tRNA-dihydrouridine synthase [Patescibacteria group bacterium]|jgi:nifR3 family TIM-barrel protein